METNESAAEFTLEIFNTTAESDDMQIVLDESFNLSIESLGRRC